jgi:cell wall-associated NlpC family hydrolase
MPDAECPMPNADCCRTPLPTDGLVGLPYVRGGVVPQVDGGVDCYGLARLALARLGVHWPATPEELLAAPSGQGLGDAQRLDGTQPPEPGDVVVCVLHGVQHLAVMVTAETALHTARGQTSSLISLATLRGLTDTQPRLYRVRAGHQPGANA